MDGVQEAETEETNMCEKLKYHHSLYLGESISETKLDKIKRRLKKRPLLSTVYLLTVSRNESDQLEIFQAKQLVQSYYTKYPVYVIGIASDYNEAVALVEQIVRECLRERGDCALKEYLLC